MLAVPPPLATPIGAPPRTQQRADEHLARGILGLGVRPEDVAARAARASLLQAHASALRLTLRRLLRHDDLASLSFAMRSWQSGVALCVHRQIKEEASARSEAAVRAAAEAAYARGAAESGEAGHRAAGLITSLTEQLEEANAKVAASERMRARESSAADLAYDELLRTGEQQISEISSLKLRLSALEASAAEREAAATEQRRVAQAAQAIALRRTRAIALKAALATAAERETHSTMRRALLEWAWGISAHAARCEWHQALCRPRLLLLRRLVRAKVDAGLRQTLRRWHSTLVVSAVANAMQEAADARIAAIATRHATAATLALDVREKRDASDIAFALGTWLRACLLGESQRAQASLADAVALRVQLASAVETSRAATEAERIRAQAANDQYAEAEGSLRSQLSEVRREFELERSRLEAELAAAREEGAEVCRAAAHESSRLREAAHATKARHAMDQRSLMHVCAGHLVISCLRNRAHSAAKAAIDAWFAASRRLGDDDLWRAVATSRDRSGPASRRSSGEQP